MKVYKKIVYDKDMNVIEEDSYDYKGPVTECKGGGGGNPVKRVFKKVSKIFKKIIKKITSFVGDVFGFVLKPFGLPELGGFDADNIASGVKLTKPGTNIGIPVVYGYRRVGLYPYLLKQTDPTTEICMWFMRWLKEKYKVLEESLSTDTLLVFLLTALITQKKLYSVVQADTLVTYNLNV